MQYYEHRDPNRFQYMEWVDKTNVHPVMVGMVLLAFLLLLAGPRRLWIFAIGLTVCMIPTAQRVVISGVDFSTIRIVAVSSILALAVRGDFKSIRFARFDYIVALSCMLPWIMALIRGNSSQIVTFFGIGLDYFTFFLIGRVAIRSLRDVEHLAKALILIAIPVGLALANEKLTGRNVFHFLGGVPEFTIIREGKLRAQAAFPHSIIAGCWLAASIPLILTLRYLRRGSQMTSILVLLGCLVCCVGVFGTASSTPIGGLLAAILAIVVFPMRAHLKSFRLAAVFVGIALHLAAGRGLHGVLYTQFTFVSGSTGYHRYKMVQGCIDHVSEWFFFGSNSTYHWGWGLDDIMHEYILAAIRGGMLGLGLLIYILYKCFSNAGKLMAVPDKRYLIVGYLFGASIWVHAVNWLGGSYFGQAPLLYYITVGGLHTLACSVPELSVRRSTSSVRVRSGPSGVPV